MMKKKAQILKDNLLNRLYRYKIYKRLTLFFIIVCVFPILLIGSYNGVYSLVQNIGQANLFLEESTVQIVNNISNYIYDYMDLLDEIAVNPTVVDEIERYDSAAWDEKSEIENHIRLVLGNTFGAGGAINTVEMVTADYAYFYYPSPISSGDFDDSLILNREAKYVETIVGPKEILSDSNRYIILTRGIYNYHSAFLGNVVAALEMSYFNKVCFKNVGELRNEVLIVDDNNIIISASNESIVGMTFEENTFSSITISRSIPRTGLKVVNRIDIGTLFRSPLIQFGITLLIAVVFAAFAMIFALLFAKSISLPINKLIREMGEDDIDKYVEDNGNDEYHQVIEGFNKVSVHLKRAVERQYQLKLQATELRELRKEAELSALQQQINPHFLYNTLESIYWSGQLEGDEEISEIVNALSNYLRVIIDKGREYVNVEDEVTSVNNYIFLQNKRFGERIKVDWYVSGELKKTEVIKLIIHPIVEDIIAKNLDDLMDEIELSVAIELKGENLLIKLKGQAVDYMISLIYSEAELELKGISSVNERLELYYGHDFGVQISEDQISVLLPTYKDRDKGGNTNG